jgi:hypothetical protein
MARASICLALVLAILAEPAAAGRGGPNATRTQKEKATEVQKPTAVNSGAAGRCKKYFAVIGAVVSVPC